MFSFVYFLTLCITIVLFCLLKQISTQQTGYLNNDTCFIKKCEKLKLELKNKIKTNNNNNNNNSNNNNKDNNHTFLNSNSDYNIRPRRSVRSIFASASKQQQMQQQQMQQQNMAVKSVNKNVVYSENSTESTNVVLQRVPKLEEALNMEKEKNMNLNIENMEIKHKNKELKKEFEKLDRSYKTLQETLNNVFNAKQSVEIQNNELKKRFKDTEKVISDMQFENKELETDRRKFENMVHKLLKSLRGNKVTKKKK